MSHVANETDLRRYVQIQQLQEQLATALNEKEMAVSLLNVCFVSLHVMGSTRAGCMTRCPVTHHRQQESRRS